MHEPDRVGLDYRIDQFGGATITGETTFQVWAVPGRPQRAGQRQTREILRYAHYDSRSCFSALGTSR